jgi:hypothetical protein
VDNLPALYQIRSAIFLSNSRGAKETAFVELLKQKRAEARGVRPESPPRLRFEVVHGAVGENKMSFIETLQQIKAEVQPNDPADPWRLPLERV